MKEMGRPGRDSVLKNTEICNISRLFFSAILSVFGAQLLNEILQGRQLSTVDQGELLQNTSMQTKPSL